MRELVTRLLKLLLPVRRQEMTGWLDGSNQIFANIRRNPPSQSVRRELRRMNDKPVQFYRPPLPSHCSAALLTCVVFTTAASTQHRPHQTMESRDSNNCNYFNSLFFRNK